MGIAKSLGITALGLVAVFGAIWVFRNQLTGGASTVGSTIGSIFGNLLGNVPSGFIGGFNTSTAAAGMALSDFGKSLVSGTIFQGAFGDGMSNAPLAGNQPAPTPENNAPSVSNKMTSISATAFANMAPAAPIMNLKQGALQIAASGSPSDILAAGITVRGNTLTPYLQSMKNVVVGIVSDNILGSREVAGSQALFERLASNLGR